MIMEREKLERLKDGAKLYIPPENGVVRAEFYGFKLDGRVWVDIDGAATVAPTWCLYRTKREALKAIKKDKKN